MIQTALFRAQDYSSLVILSSIVVCRETTVKGSARIRQPDAISQPARDADRGGMPSRSTVTTVL
jgi:hypothetical protein